MVLIGQTYNLLHLFGTGGEENGQRGFRRDPAAVVRRAGRADVGFCTDLRRILDGEKGFDVRFHVAHVQGFPPTFVLTWTIAASVARNLMHCPSVYSRRSSAAVPIRATRIA